MRAQSRTDREKRRWKKSDSRDTRDQGKKVGVAAAGVLQRSLFIETTHSYAHPNTSIASTVKFRFPANVSVVKTVPENAGTTSYELGWEELKLATCILPPMYRSWPPPKVGP